MQRVQPFQVVTFGVLVIAGALLAATLLISPTSAADTNANVNIDNVAPTISVLSRGSSVDGAWVSNDTLTPIAGGNNILTVNADVTDLNGFANQTITVTAVADRTTGLVSDYSCTGNDHNCVPRTGPVTCTTGEVGATTREYQCIIPIKYNSDPTDTGTQAAPGENYVAEEWDYIIRANDTVVNVDNKTSQFEYAEVVALTFNGASDFDFGTTATDGTETPADAGSAVGPQVTNRGNTQIDYQTQVDKATAAAAWTCTGTGNPLIEDLRIDVASNTPYASMTPATNSASTVTLDENLDRNNDGSSVAPQNGFFMRFATTEAITPGTCTLSALAVSAIKST